MDYTRLIAVGALVLLVFVASLVRRKPDLSNYDGINLFDPMAISDLQAPVIVTCSTKNAPIDYHVNICAGRKWKGYKTKVNTLREYARSLDADRLVVFIDSDVFANPSRVSSLKDTWEDFKADIVLSAEELCWLGRDCTKQDIRDYYSSVDKRFNFVNSGGIMGKAGAIYDALASVTGDITDDQLLWTQLYAKKFPFKGTIALDTSNRIFGSVITATFSVPLRGIIFRIKGTCAIGGEVKINGCEIAARKVTLGESCDFTDEIGNTPIFWHANGPSRVIKAPWKKMLSRRDACIVEHRASERVNAMG